MTHLATISKTFEFSASHQLVGLEDTHPCSRLHGHNYIVRLELTGYTDHIGFVIDYRELAWFKDGVDRWDHQHLNNHLPFNPTAENMADHLLTEALTYLHEHYPDEALRLTSASVSVSETPKTWATATSPRPWDTAQLPGHKAAQELRWPGSPFEHDEALRSELGDIDPHVLDADRYRWNFDHDGSGK